MFTETTDPFIKVPYKRTFLTTVLIIDSSLFSHLSSKKYLLPVSSFVKKSTAFSVPELEGETLDISAVAE